MTHWYAVNYIGDRKALEFYADKTNYLHYIEEDFGAIATTALKGMEDKV